MTGTPLRGGAGASIGQARSLCRKQQLCLQLPAKMKLKDILQKGNSRHLILRFFSLSRSPRTSPPLSPRLSACYQTCSGRGLASAERAKVLSNWFVIDFRGKLIVRSESKKMLSRPARQPRAPPTPPAKQGSSSQVTCTCQDNMCIVCDFKYPKIGTCCAKKHQNLF